MLKVCIDTIVWLSGFFFSGPPAELVQQVLNRRLYLVLSSFILREVEKNLVSKFGVKTRAAKRLHYRIAQIADLFEPTGTIKIDSISKEDCLVLETAILGRARYLVTGDKRILALKHYKHVRIIEPAHLIQLIRR